MLDKRLKAAADYVRKGAACADIGTDHGYLAVYLYKNNITNKIVACDINEKPLKAAQNTLDENKLTDKIRLILSNGLSNVKSDDAEDILICGMGGELIMSIILDCNYTKNADKRYILQPMTNVSYLRKELYKNGFSIISETPVVDRHHIYTIIYACFTGEIVEISDVFSLVGKVPQSPLPQAKTYLEHIYKCEKTVADGLNKSSEKVAASYLHYELAAQINQLLEEL